MAKTPRRVAFEMVNPGGNLGSSAVLQVFVHSPFGVIDDFLEQGSHAPAGVYFLSAIVSVPAAASTITLSGGDPGEGYAPLGTTFAAVNVGEALAFTVQGVNFAVSDPRISLSAGAPSNQNVANLGASVNDVALQEARLTRAL